MIILIRGGSIPAGTGVPKSYVDLLREHYAPFGIEVCNRSNPKETSFDGVEALRADIEQIRPEIIILHFGIDDAFSSVYRSEFKENLVQMVRLGRKLPGIEIILPTSHIFENPDEMNIMQMYYRVIREVASNLDCDFIPVHTYWAAYIQSRCLSNSAFLQSDVRYPNDRGHNIFAEAFIWKLNRILERNGFF
jgi:hypothetical protein